MPPIKNFYSVRPIDLQPGDHLFVLIKAIVGPNGEFKLYRCPPPEELQFDEIPAEAIPQGVPLPHESAHHVAHATMPVLVWRQDEYQHQQGA